MRTNKLVGGSQSPNVLCHSNLVKGKNNQEFDKNGASTSKCIINGRNLP